VAVTVTSQTAAGAPFGVFTLDGEKKREVENHPFELLLQHPNPMQSRFEFMEAMIGFREITGNAYVWLNRTTPDAPPSEMWLIPPQQIEPVPDERMYIKGYAYDPGDGRKIPLERWEVCHLKRFHPRNRFVGLSPIEALAITAQGDLAMSKWNTNFFDKDNAKPAGALAFADRINNSDWETMKRDLIKEHGGTERKLMTLRGAGQGGVQWVQFGINQRDMEFLAAREFNKEEIYSAFAPGLSSMLAINATEANSKVGKATFREMAIWPIHQAVGEKFTADILPAYGDNLVGQFEDVRVVDRAIVIQEQETAYQVMTISEAREKFYDLEPLGDDRDDQLVTGAPAPTEPETDLAPEPPEVATTAPPEPSETPEAIKRVSVVDVKPKSDLKADLHRWQRKSIKRVKAGRAALCEFESEFIPDSLSEAIKGALETTTTAPAVHGLFEGVIVWEGYP
jgi:HK97 family phage portal protein